jgi:hypothetical protein
MTFLAAGFLVLLALAGLPPLIHWLARRRREIAWAAMTILRRVLARTRRKAQARELVILALRCLAVMLIVLAFARPAMHGAGEAGGGGLVCLVIDASGSMGARVGAESRMDRAKARTKELIAKLPAGSRAAVVVAPALTADGKVGAVAGEATSDRAALAAAVDRIQPGAAAFDPAAALAAAARCLAAGVGGRSLILVSDFQAGDWTAEAASALSPAIAALNALDPRPVVRLVDAGDGELADVAVTAIAPDDPLPVAGRAAPVRAVVRARGGAAPAPLALSLIVTTPDQAKGRVVDSRVIPRLDGSATVQFSATLPAGLVALEARAQADRLAVTDSARCVVEVVERVETLVVDGRGATEGFTGASPFLAAAIAPAGELSSFRATRITPIQLAPSRLRGVRAVALADVPDLPAPVAEALVAWVRAGGVLLAFMGGEVQPAAWNRLLAQVLPGRLDAPQRLPGDGAGLEPAGDHALLQPFAAAEFQPLLRRPRLRTVMGITLASETAPEVVAKAGGRPVIATAALGRGRIWWYATSADRSWGDLCLHPAFLPLVQRAIQLGLAGHTPPTAPAGAVAVVGGGPELIGRQATVTAPDGATASRTWEAAPGGERSRLDIPGTLHAGIYRLAGAGGAGLVAVDAPAGEGDLTAITAGDLARRLPGLAVVGDLDPAGGREIGWWLLLLALSCLAAETALAAWWAPRDEDEGSEGVSA